MIDGQPIASGTVFTTQMTLIHTDEELFKNHTEFRPERFLENNNLEKKLIPFGIGKRSCLGESLARAELYLVSYMNSSSHKVAHFRSSEILFSTTTLNRSAVFRKFRQYLRSLSSKGRRLTVSDSSRGLEPTSMITSINSCFVNKCFLRQTPFPSQTTHFLRE